MGLAARKFAGTPGWEAVLNDMLQLHSRLAGVRPNLAARVWKAVSFQLSSDEPPAHEKGAEDEGGGGAKDQPTDEGGTVLGQ